MVHIHADRGVCAIDAQDRKERNRGGREGRRGKILFNGQGGGGGGEGKGSGREERRRKMRERKGLKTNDGGFVVGKAGAPVGGRSSTCSSFVSFARMDHVSAFGGEC